MIAKKYDIEFKKTLVDLFQSGQSVTSLSKEFGVASGTLYKWIDLYGKSKVSGVSKDELRQLKRENTKLMEQNEILKKSYRHLHEQVGTGGDKILIQNLRKEFPLTQVTEILEVSRSTYYAQVNHKKSQTQIEQENLEVQIKKEYHASKGRYGAPKILQKLLQNGTKCSLKRVQRLMRKLGLQSIIRKKWKPKSSVKSERNHLPNLMKQDFTAEQLNQKWSTDMTYIHTLKNGWCYLSSIMDLCSKKIIAWDFSKEMETELIIQTIDKVAYRENKGLILQTDQGIQYLSNTYEERLCELGIVHSYSQKRYPYDNSIIESFHALLKKEEVYQTIYPDFESAKQALFRYIEGWYNENRIHSRINYLTPNQVEKAA